MINTRKIKDLFKYNKLTGGLYSTALTIRDNRRYHNKFDYHGTYIDRKQRKKYFLTPFALHRNIQTARKAFIYGLFRNLVRYSNSASPKIFLNIFV